MHSAMCRIWILFFLLQNVVSWGDRCDTNQDQTFCSIGLCTIPECQQCGAMSSVCQTTSLREPVPSTLPKTTRLLLLHYTGEPATLHSRMFARYSTTLRNITLYGNFDAIASRTFYSLENLSFLTIRNTNISSLPSDLFNDSNFLFVLILTNNKFNSIPENTFHSLSRVTHMDFSFNPIDVCKQRTIADRFSRLPRLASLYLAGLGANPAQNCTLNNDFLKPLARIGMIDLSESHILQNNPLLLKSLAHLSELRLNYLEPYTKCPSLANELFKNLPRNLSKFSAEGWKTNSAMMKSCALNETSFDSFRDLKLSSISYRNSDKILGDRLTAKMFKGINLKSLDLTWCRLSAIDEDTFDSIPNLSFLALNGNQLGPREFKIFTTPRTGTRLKTLLLKNVGAFSNDRTVYSMGDILEHSPNLDTLIVDGNFMEKLPTFSSTTTVYNKTYQITKLGFDDNRLSDLSVSVTEELCTLMPKLLSISAKNNLLDDITGLCHGVREVRLADNRVGINEDKNLRAVKQLVHLQDFDMRRNGIKILPVDLLWQMPNLLTFYFGGNEILHVPEKFFSYNTKLWLIDLSNNLLTSIDFAMFNSSDSLVKIFLQGNLLTHIPREITQQIDILANKSRHKLLIFHIAANPFDCSCDDYLQNWVRDSTVVADVKRLTCSEVDEESRMGNRVYNYTPSTFHCKLKSPLTIGGSILLAIVLTLPVGIFLYRNRWYITHARVVARAMKMSAKQIKMEQQSEYDAFVSYDVKNDDNSLWVMHFLIPEIEGKTIEEACGDLPTNQSQTSEGSFRLYIHERDSNIGTQKYTELCNAVEDSRKLIILLSNSYLASSACLNEANLLAGYETDKSECYHPDRILILVLDELDQEIIRPPITGLLQLNVIDVTPRIRENARKMKSIWGRIRKFVSKPSILYKKASTKKRRVDTDTAYHQFN